MRSTRVFIAVAIVATLGSLLYLNSSRQQPMEPRETLAGKVSSAPRPSAPTAEVAAVPVAFATLPIPEKFDGDPMNLVRATKHKTGLLFKIEKPGLKTSYVVGTIHYLNDDVRKVADAVKTALEGSASFCTEISLDGKTMLAVQEAMLYPDKTMNLRKDIGEELYGKLDTLAKAQGLPMAMLDQIQPWAVMVILAMPDMSGASLDLHLQIKAKEKNIALCGLETAEEQLGALQMGSRENQLKMLRSVIEHHAEVQAQNKELIKFYLARDLKSMMQLLENDPTTPDPVVKAQFIVNLLIKRNILMVNRMQPYLHKGNAFFAVGAAHLPGEKGILQLLESLGYQITLVY